MPLSEHEQRLLEQMERALYAEDPRFASSLRDGAGRRGSPRRMVLGVLGFLIGLSLLVTGVAVTQEIVGVIGFVMMLGGAFLTFRAMRAPAAQVTVDDGAAKKPAKSSDGFMNRVEDRWNRRRDEQ